ncbi:MAG: hypothetical protein V1866_05800 [archaeon]
MEFVSVIGLVMIVVLILTGSLYYLYSNYSEQRTMNELLDLGYSLQSELILAGQVEPGYIRILMIPDQINGESFIISQSSNDLVLSYKGSDILFRIPSVSGSLKKGTNTITKAGNFTIDIS